MPVDAPDSNFLRYLTCDLPLGYPLKTPVTRLLMPTLTISSRRELLHQQSQFLDWAKPFLGTHPWIAYLAAIKHEAVLVTIPTYASQLVDVVDIVFFTDLQQKCRQLREAAHAAIDQPTAQDCDRLVLLQSEAAQIEDATKNFNAALKAGFTAVEPLPPALPEPEPDHGSLPYFIAGGVACLIVGAIIPPHYGGMAWGLMGAVITGIVGTPVVKREKSRVNPESEKFRAHLLHENYFSLCRKSVALVLALPFDTRKAALVNLPQCLTALEALHPEREALEARYIKPFVPE